CIAYDTKNRIKQQNAWYAQMAVPSIFILVHHFSTPSENTVSKRIYANCLLFGKTVVFQRIGGITTFLFVIVPLIHQNK
ncbi:MAG TPA: hypothetical protein DHV89_01315, partial [Ruminococcus sp.]|nr:hypothetical protein [Ruminococcus sp.]